MKPAVLWHLLWLSLALGAGPAHAHAPVPGIKGFYVGLLHPLSTPAQALVMLGLGLLVGHVSDQRLKWFFGTFLLLSLVGVIAGSATLDLDAAMFAVAIIACSLAALIPGKLMPLALAATATGALLIGSVSIPDDGPTMDRFFTMTGSIVGANAGLLCLWGGITYLTERFDRQWVKIAFRVAAAWLGAIALMMLALGFADESQTVQQAYLVRD